MNTSQKNENKFICSYCKKIYIRKASYNNHLIKCRLCRFSSNCGKTELESESELELESESVCAPVVTMDSLKKDLTIHNLFAMVIMLYNKYEKLESEYTELKKYVTITKNKINILDYLNENFKHDYMNMDARGTNITKFMDELVIGEDQLQKIFKYDYVDGIFNIICDYKTLMDPAYSCSRIRFTESARCDSSLITGMITLTAGALLICRAELRVRKQA
jgi:hypothetical protein